MDLVDQDQIFRVESDRVRYLQLHRASIETDSVVHTPRGFHQSNSTGRLRSVTSLEEACDLGQKAAIGLRKLTDDVVP